jgi:ubiquinone/menaquinone biosynthesis C-methylase UbiE
METDTLHPPTPAGGQTVAAPPDPTPEPTGAQAFAERLFGATLSALELLHVYLGDRLGLYRALAGGSPLSSLELAQRAGIAPRYAREWLEQQAVAGYLEVAESSDDPDARRYALDPGHAEVLLDDTSLAYLVPLVSGVVGVARTLPAVAEAFRTGDGVAYASYGEDVRGCVSRVNRPMFLNQLAQEWLPALPDVDARLRTDPSARVADVGCGTGWSSIAIALGYPTAQVDGFDLDEASIAQARINAGQAGVADRVSFEVRDAAEVASAGANYDLVCAFETLHDMADPVGALRAMRALALQRGAVLIGDEKVAETFTAPGDELERFNYGWSALHCLPVGLVDPPAVGTGTIMRPAILRRYAVEAGFHDVEILPVEHDFWRFYRLNG